MTCLRLDIRGKVIQNYLTVFLIIASFAVNSQNILIPYREGNLWGVSDSLGNIIVKPVYDRVDFEETGSGFFKTTKNGRHGIVSNKEIIKPVFETIRGSLYFEADSTINSGTVKFFFNTDGDPLFPGNYTSMWLTARIERNFYQYDYPLLKPLFLFFTGLDTVGRPGLFCYDVDHPKESKLIFEGKENDPDGIDVRSINAFNKVFMVEDKYILMSYDLTKRKLKISIFKTEKELKIAENKIRKESEDHIQKPKKVEYSNADVYIPPKVRIESYYKLVDGELFLESSYENIQNRRYYTSLEKVDLNLKEYAISIHWGNTFIMEKDTVINYSIFVIYEKNNKHGLVWGDKIVPNIYDSLCYVSVDSFQFFIYGIRDSTGNMKLGTMKPDGTVIIDPVYTEINFKNNSRNDYFSSYLWIVKKESRYGLISQKNEVILDFIYDTIFRANGIINVKRNGLYGVCYLKYGDGSFTAPLIVVEPFIPYRIRRIIYLPRTNEMTQNLIQLLELVDKEGQIIGYANPNGLKYFSD